LEPGSEAAVALRDDELIAPVLWLAEAHVLWQRVRIGDITAAEPNTRLFELLNAPIASASMEPHLDQALRLGPRSATRFTIASILHSPYSSRRIL
jgi:hypothetical protein